MRFDFRVDGDFLIWEDESSGHGGALDLTQVFSLSKKSHQNFTLGDGLLLFFTSSSGAKVGLPLMLKEDHDRLIPQIMAVMASSRIGGS